MRAGQKTLLWKSTIYNLILIDVRKHLQGEVVDLVRQIKARFPQQRIAFSVGPPLYISKDWPGEVIEKRETPCPARAIACAAAGGAR